MKVFVTGAAGFIGQAVIQDLQNHGHSVIGLARSDSAASKVSGLGAEVLRGDLEDLESLRRGAAASDAIIHLAFVFNLEDFEGCCAIDRAAITAMAEAIEGTGKPLVITSGTLLLEKNALRDEESPLEKGTPFAARSLSEDLIRKLSVEKKIRGAVVRLAPTVHGKGDHGFIPMLADSAKKNGYTAYIGEGKTRWPAVARFDAATLFRLVIEKGRAGAVYHGVAEEGVPTKETIEAMGKKLNLPVHSKSMEEVAGAFGFLGHVLALDNPVSSEKTRKELGWEPTHAKLIPDIAADYF